VHHFGLGLRHGACPTTANAAHVVPGTQAGRATTFRFLVPGLGARHSIHLSWAGYGVSFLCARHSIQTGGGVSFCARRLNWVGYGVSLLGVRHSSKVGHMLCQMLCQALKLGELRRFASWCQVFVPGTQSRRVAGFRFVPGASFLCQALKLGGLRRFASWCHASWCQALKPGGRRGFVLCQALNLGRLRRLVSWCQALNPGGWRGFVLCQALHSFCARHLSWAGYGASFFCARHSIQAGGGVSFVPSFVPGT
jgi:hypothetical protein